MPRAAKRKQEAAPEGWRSRIVGEGDVAPDQLLAHPLNARRHPNEIEPKYVQVAIERWSAYTGETAVSA